MSFEEEIFHALSDEYDRLVDEYIDQVIRGEETGEPLGILNTPNLRIVEAEEAP